MGCGRSKTAYMGRLVILSGPSCVGKGPLLTALRKLRPDLAGRMTKIVLYDSRSPRPGEVDGVDYRFRTREYIEGLRGKEGFTVFEERSDEAISIPWMGDCLAALAMTCQIAASR